MEFLSEKVGEDSRSATQTSRRRCPTSYPRNASAELREYLTDEYRIYSGIHKY